MKDNATARGGNLAPQSRTWRRAGTADARYVDNATRTDQIVTPNPPFREEACVQTEHPIKSEAERYVIWMF